MFPCTNLRDLICSISMAYGSKIYPHSAAVRGFPAHDDKSPAIFRFASVPLFSTMISKAVREANLTDDSVNGVVDVK